MSFDDFEAAVRPKVEGTVNLHKALSSTPLDFFIMMSSLVGIIGNSGQGNYAAGCAFQDAFARYRRSQGLPAHSLDCGMIESAGYISENPQVARYLSSLGWVPIELQELLALLNNIIMEPTRTVNGCQTLVGLLGSKYRPGTTMPASLRGAKFRHLQLAGHVAGEQVKDGDAINVKKGLSEALSPQVALHILQSALLVKISRLLSIPVSEISTSQTFMELGADSLVAVELRNWIAKELEAKVQIFEVTRNYPISGFVGLLALRSKLINPDIFCR